MKGLDTPVLLRILLGEPSARKLLRELQGEELATTEWNLLELEMISRSLDAPGKERRRAMIEKLRRRLTVLPLDERAVEAAAHNLVRSRRPRDLIGAAILAVLESRGCSELLTSGSSFSKLGTKAKVRVRMV
jgi:predicted nucleic acid-binding protein